MRVEEILQRSSPDQGETTLAMVEKPLSTRERVEPEAGARLRGEAALLAALGGRVTPRLLDAGEDDAGPWLRMEKIAFPTLAWRLEQSAARPLDVAWIERAARAAFDALIYLHEASDDAGPLRIVHADLSPANLAIDDSGTRVVLLDFDLACWRGAPTRDGAFRGTVAYSAPEVARGEQPTVVSDLFSLAASFLHAATGLPPRDGPSLAAVLAKAGDEALLLDTGVPAKADLAARGPAHAALVRCLAHDPTERPRSAREVFAAPR